MESLEYYESLKKKSLCKHHLLQTFLVVLELWDGKGYFKLLILNRWRKTFFWQTVMYFQIAP